MGFLNLYTIFAFLTVTVLVGRASHAADHLPLLPQLYWKSALPYTRMPKAISQLILKPDFISGEPGKNFILHKQDPADTQVGIYKQDAAEKLMFGYQKDAAVEKLMFGYQKDAAEELMFGYQKDAAEELMFGYQKDAAADNQILEDPTRVVFFLEKDMHPGTTMNYRLAGNSTRDTFLSCKTADSIPFSSSKLPEILNQFSLKPGSVEAGIIKDTIQHCEKPATRGEEKYCATSLESMVDFTTSKIGRNIQALSTEVEKGAAPLQNYTITTGVKELAGTIDKLVACHKMSYAYAVFYCHAFENTRAYMVPLEGADGTKAKAVAVCHEDTSAWSPNFFAFRTLKVKPGTAPICHFLKDENIAWLPNQKPT